MGNQRSADPSRALDPWDFRRLNMDGQVDLLEEGSNALDGVTHHLAPDMVWVVVGGEHADRRHLVSVEYRQQVGDGIGRVHQQCLSGLAISNGIGKVDHGPSDRVIASEVPPGEQLAEVEAVARLSHR